MSSLRSDDGPQAERSRRIEAQAYLQDPVPSLPVVAATSTSANRLERDNDIIGASSASTPSTSYVENARLADERDFLRKYVERLLAQLRALLHKYGEMERLKVLADPNVLVGDDDDGALAARNGVGQSNLQAPWLTAPEYISPLFQAYDLKIQDLETAVDDGRTAMDRFASRAEALANENSALRQELEGAAERLALQCMQAPKELHGMGDPLLSLNDDGEYMQEFNERVDVLMSENNMLMEQVSLQDDEINAMKKELMDRDQQLQAMEQNFSEATAAIQGLRDSCVRLRDEKQHCEKQLQHYATVIAQLESTKDTHTQRIEAAHVDKASLENQLAEYETLLSNAKKNALRKDEQYSTRYQNVCSRLRDLNAVIETKDKQLDEAQEKAAVLQAEIEAVRQDCEGMLGVMNSMEKQLSQYSDREDAVAELEAECKTKVEELLLQKEEVSARETQSRREIARLLERLQQQAAMHLKSEEENVAAVERKYKLELKSREEEVQSLSNQLSQLRSSTDVLARNHKDSERKLAEVVRHGSEASGLFERKLRQLADRAAEAEEARDASSRLEGDYTQKLQAKEKEILKLRTDMRERTQELNDKVSTLERELEIRRSEVREAKDSIEEKHQKMQMLNEQLVKVKTDCSTRFERELEVLYQQNRELKVQVETFEYKLAQAKKDAASAMDSTQNERERAEVRFIAEIESLKGRVQSLKDERSRVEKARQETESRCGVLSMQIQQLSRELSDTKELLYEHEHACDDSDRKVTELSSQLTLALSKQQQLYRQERELRSALERMTLEHARAEREAKNCRKKLEEHRAESYSYLSKSRSLGPTERLAGLSETRMRSPLVLNLSDKVPGSPGDSVYGLSS